MAVHEFYSTGDAYDACQTDSTIKDGDILIIESEQVVGLAGTWPCAITVQSGDLHKINMGADPTEIFKTTERQIKIAVDFAVACGYEIDETFKSWV